MKALTDKRTWERQWTASGEQCTCTTCTVKRSKPAEPPPTTSGAASCRHWKEVSMWESSFRLRFAHHVWQRLKVSSVLETRFWCPLEAPAPVPDFLIFCFLNAVNVTTHFSRFCLWGHSVLHSCKFVILESLNTVYADLLLFRADSRRPLFRRPFLSGIYFFWVRFLSHP